jgi:hypothetical protein
MVHDPRCLAREAWGRAPPTSISRMEHFARFIRVTRASQVALVGPIAARDSPGA